MSHNFVTGMIKFININITRLDKRACNCRNTLQSQKYHVCLKSSGEHRSAEWWDGWRCCDEVW